MSSQMLAAAPSDASSGFAQILALAGLALVGGLLSVVLVQAHRTSQSLGLLERHVLGDVTARSAVHRLLAAIENPVDNLEQRVGMGGGAYRLESNEPVWLTIEGEAGKLDVLHADMAIVTTYLERSGLSTAGMQAVLQALMDARREDAAPAALEALSVAFARLGSGDQIDEDFTALSRLAGVNPMLASERVLRAIPDLSESDVANILRDRSEMGTPIGVESRYFSTGKPLFTVVATVKWSETERYVKRVPIEITTGGRAQVLSGFR